MKKFIAFLLICTFSISLTACSLTNLINDALGNSAEYDKYVQSILDTYYKGDFSQYLNQVETTQEEAQELYDDTMSNYGLYFMEHLGINTEYIDDSVVDAYTELAKQVCAKAKYTVGKPEKISDGYCVKVKVSPMDFLKIIRDPAVKYINEFEKDYENTDFEIYSDEDWKNYETKFSNNMLEVIKPYVEKTSYGDAVETVIQINFDSSTYYVNDNDWTNIDTYILDLQATQDTNE